MYIYKITHKSTHQCYIGQTLNLFERWHEHSHDNKTPIQKAIKEEGISAFTFEVLEECEPREADERETHWINYYHAYGAGYNTNRGCGTCEPVQTIESGIKPSIAQNNRSHANSPDGVDAYDPRTGQLVAHYNSIADANRALGKEGTGNISAVCRGRGRTAYGYIWKYTTPQQ
jgi:predicted GIY-YIG superfamily endonuclease